MPDTSNENSKKLDRLLALIEGEHDAPGILSKLALHDEVLFGRNGWGMVSRVNLMWRIHVWVLCALSGIAGYLFKAAIVHAKL
jgi:hypothetical protein